MLRSRVSINAAERYTGWIQNAEHGFTPFR